jgi:hypothetical protein
MFNIYTILKGKISILTTKLDRCMHVQNDATCRNWCLSKCNHSITSHEMKVRFIKRRGSVVNTPSYLGSRVQLSYRKPAIMTEGFRGFPHSLQEKCRDNALNRPQLLPSTSFPIHNLPITLSFNAVFSKFLKRRRLIIYHKYRNMFLQLKLLHNIAWDGNTSVNCN